MKYAALVTLATSLIAMDSQANTSMTESIAPSVPAASTGVDTSARSPSAPISPQDQSTPSLPLPLKICGEAKLSVMFWDIYQSTLYTPGGQWRPDIRPLRLEIQYLRNIEAADLVNQTGKEWRAQGILTPQHELWLEELNTLWRDVQENDVITLDIALDGVSTFSLNGERLGSLMDPQFGEDFSGIWLSPKTTRPELRAALIGGNERVGEATSR